MQPIRNIHFTLLIRAANRLREFNFRKRSSSLYDTDVSDDRGNRFFFKMILENDRWQPRGINLPYWVTDDNTAIHESLAARDLELA